MMRLFEAFAGYGSQRSASKRYGIETESVGIAEVDISAIRAYYNLHCKEPIDFIYPDIEIMLKELNDKNIAFNYKSNKSFWVKMIDKLFAQKKELSIKNIETIKEYYKMVTATKNYGDITKLITEELPDMDLLSTTFPCKSISMAGKQKGLEKGSGTRSSLLWECERIIEGKRPKFILLENVKALVNKKNKPHFDKWLEILEGLGYNNYWKIINAKWCGIPQNRDRVFVVSIRKDIDNGLFSFYDDFDNGIRLKDMLENEVDEKYYLSNEKVKGLIGTIKEKNSHLLNKIGNVNPSGNGMNGAVYHSDNLAPTVTTNKGEGSKILVREPIKKTCKKIYSGDSIHANNKIIQLGNLIQTESFGGNPQTGRVYSDEGISPTLNTCGGGQREPKILENKIMKVDIPQEVRVRKHECDIEELKLLLKSHKNISGLTIRNISDKLDKNKTEVEHWFRSDKSFSIPNEVIWFDLKKLLNIEDDKFDAYVTEFEIKEGVYEKSNRCYLVDGIAPTLTATTADEKIIVNYRIRKLTPYECFKLMGLSHEEAMILINSGLSNSQLYKLAGNSIVVNCMRFLKKLDIMD